MKMQIERYRLLVVPENDTDEAYLEEVLGLRKAGDYAPMVRENAMGLGCWAYAEVKRIEAKPWAKKEGA
jgi:hypothetical protein